MARSPLVRWNLFVEEELLTDLKRFADEQHVSAASVARYALRKYMQAVRKPPQTAPHAHVPPVQLHLPIDG